MNHASRSAIFTVATVLGIAVSAPVLAAERVKMTIASGHPEVFLWIKHMKQTFIPVLAAELEKHGEIEIEWTEGYGGTIVKVGSEVEAFESGIIDVGHVNSVFNPATLGIMNLTYAMPFGPADAELVAMAAENALSETGMFDRLADTAGVVNIGGSIAIDDYNIASTDPIATLADLKGVKVAGAGPNLAWLRTTGAVGVQGSYVTFYNEMKVGVYDANIGWMTANVPAKLYEVAPNWNLVHFGAMYVGGLGVSKQRWDTLSDNTKEAMKTAAAAYSKAYFEEQAARYDASKNTLLENGGKIIEFSAADRETWIKQMPNPVTEWKAAAEARGEDAGAVLKAYQSALEKGGFTFVRDYLAN